MRMVEVIYEDGVFRPLTTIKGITKHEKAWVIFSSHTKKNLHELVGTLTQEESKEMRKLINKEFEKIEGEW